MKSEKPTPSPENVMPYGSDEAKSGQVRRMFDSIARRYDMMNTIMTFGLHRRWRDVALNMIPSSPVPKAILDVATGTGDVAFRLHELFPETDIKGIDLSSGMLAIAREKAHEKNLSDKIEFIEADSLSLPFPDNSFDAVTVAYGVRNFERLGEGYREMMRVLRPGGMICVIELSEPRNPILNFGYRIYSQGIIPAIGRIVSRDSRAYTYLPESIAKCPSGNDMTRLMTTSGFIQAAYRQLTFGAVTVYTALKP